MITITFECSSCYFENIEIFDTIKEAIECLSTVKHDPPLCRECISLND